MTRAAAPKLAAYAGLCASALLAALVLRRPELVALAAPFALALAFGLAVSERARISVKPTLEPGRAIEGDEVTLSLELTAGAPVERLELLVDLPPGLEPVGEARAVALRLRRGETRLLELRLRAARWGGYALGRVHLRATSPFGLLVEEGRAEEAGSLRVYPREEELRRLLAPRETQLSAGNQVARTKGDGIEFADVRRYAPGDRIRRVNWRASARRGELWVNEAHPERNTDVILFLDSFTEARRGGRSTLDLAVRAAASLAEAYLARRDRVGLVGFGGILRWLLPGSGRVQAYRIADALLDTEIVFSYAWKDVEVLPARTLPPQALVVALSPLLDERAVGALLDLRSRGFDLAVVDVSPIPFSPPGRGELDALAHRLWRLRREALRYAYERAGVAVAEWRDDEPLQVPLEEVSSYRRHAHARRG
ncbi:MAG TPA: DUF58 domain-containing protein [Gaiellaceae bacterium]|nr:DUF58 domain-containing protein [Gaiellaceae bacterium]